MKLILKQYLASLKEREELDAILPDLLSSMGMNVFIYPRRGIRELGVDIAAVGQLNGTEEKIYLFSVKSGNLTRETWNGRAEQALRPSLDEIQDAFIPSRIPPEHKNKKIVICLCFGGDIVSGIRDLVSGYQKGKTKRKISFEEWNGDKLSDLIQKHLFKEDILPSSSQGLLRKSLALIEEPETSSEYFSQLIDDILKATDKTEVIAASIIRLNVCLWVLFSWCRDVENVESAYLSSERALLKSWEYVKNNYTKTNSSSKAFDGISNTYHQITDYYIEHCLTPYVGVKYALSCAVKSSCSIDVNIKLFDALGRLSIKGHWVLDELSKSYEKNPPIKDTNEYQDKLSLSLRKITNSIKSLVKNNPILTSPFKDSQAIDIFLALSLLSNNSDFDEFAKSWISEITNKTFFSFMSNNMYPTIYNSYDKLLAHKNETRLDKGYKEKATNASILYPTLAFFCSIYNLDLVSKELEDFVNSKLKHCTLQYWYPNSHSELSMYTNSETHGSSTVDFPMSRESILEHVSRECQHSNSLYSMSAVVNRNMTLVLTACRKYRYPIPFHIMNDWLIS